MAKDQTTNRGRGLRRYVTMISKRVTKGVLRRGRKHEAVPKEEPKRVDENTVSLERIQDIHNISNECADKVIRAFQEGKQLDFDSLMNVLDVAAEVLREEPNLLDVREKQEKEGARVSVIGDLHGSLRSLAHILEILDVDNNIVVFDGDFVDRGSSSLEVLVTLLLLKLSRPNQVYLLRGNHEDIMVAAVYGFQDEVRRKYVDHIDHVWDAVGELFAALPIALRTSNACVLHGGLPNESFNLDELNQLPPEVRFEMRSTIEPKNEEEALLAGILWSDPTERYPDSIKENPRGVGIVFGSSVARKFLRRNELQYLIRGHEPASKGLSDMDCGWGTSVITVFSAAAYPADTGSNLGAVLHLEPDGEYSHETFSIQECDEYSSDKRHQKERGMQKIRNMVGYNRSKLDKAFQNIQKNGMVTVEEWVDTMTTTVDVAGIPWSGLQPRIAPANRKTGRIDVAAFLERHSLRVHDADGLNHDEAETLAENSDMLLTVFKFLDSDGSGTLSHDEFETGITLLNRRLPAARQLKNPDELFDALDADGNGEISFEEFSRGFGMA